MALIGEMHYLTIGGNTYSIPVSGGSTVTIERALTSGTKSATISVDGTSYDLYAPTPNAGTVTSVRVQATSPVQSSTSTAQSSTLNTTISLANGYGDTKNPYASKTKNYVLAAPATENGVPSFRTLVAADIPDLSDTYATQTDLENLPEPMIFKGSLGTGGTITSLPTAAASNEGYTYKVITAGTYASQSAKVGDTFISDGSAWVLIPSGDEPSGTVTSVTLTQGTGITVSNSGTAITTSGSRTISLASITKDDTTSTASPSHGGTFTAIDSITYDTYGRVTGINTKTVTLPADSNTDTKVTQAYSTANNSYPVLFSATAGVSSTSSRGATTAILNNAIYANPSTGNLHVTQLNGVTVGTSPKFTDTTYTNVSEFTNDAGYITSYTDNKVSQSASTSNTAQPILFRNNVSSGASSSTEGVKYVNTVTITPSTGDITATKFNGYTLAAASAKGVDTSISAASASSNLPTSAAVASFVEGKGYITSADVPEGASAYTGTISAVGTSASTGTNNGFARGDHVHNITSSTITSALGYTPYNSTNPNGYISSYTDEKLKWTASTSSNTYYPLQSTSTATTSTANTLNGISFYQYYNTAGGYRRLDLGNSTAYKSTGGAYGVIRLYGAAATYYGDLVPGVLGTTSGDGHISANRTWTLPDKTGTIALTSDIPTTLPASDVSAWAKAASKPTYTASEVGALASNTTYVSTVTTTAGTHSAITSKSGAVSFNVPTKTSHLTNDSGFITSDSDENVKSTAVTAATTNYITGSTTSTTNTGGLSKHASAVIYTTANSGTSGYTQLRLGNTTATSSAGGKEGQIRLYGTSATYYIDLKAGAPSANRTLTFPNKGGTVAITDDIPSNTTLLNLFYPVGSYYETSDTTFNPNTAWGGTWVLETAGQVHVSAGTSTTSTVFTVNGANASNGVGMSDGGEEKHWLTTDEMPTHNHGYYYTGSGTGTKSLAWWSQSGNGLCYDIVNVGGNQTHNTMQPYIVVNRWHRTA